MFSYEASLKDKEIPSGSCSEADPGVLSNESPLDWSGNSEININENEKSSTSNNSDHTESKTPIKGHKLFNFSNKRPKRKAVFLLPFTPPVVRYALFVGNTTKVFVEKNYVITEHKPLWPNEVTKI